MRHVIENLCRTLQLADPSADLHHEVLFHGVEMLEVSLHIPSIAIEEELTLPMILYCRSGHLQNTPERDCILDLGKGDFALYSRLPQSVLRFPGRTFTGLFLFLHPAESDASAAQLLDTSNLSWESIQSRYLTDTCAVSLTGTAQTDPIFEKAYDQPESLQHSYRRLMVLELLLYLARNNEPVLQKQEVLLSEQVKTIHEIHDYLLEHMDMRITIDMLAHRFLMNPTTIKQVFKEVYGTSLAAHIKEHRMEMAAHYLKETDMTLAEVAKAVGYDSQSKFTASFKNYYHILPSSYKKQS